MNGTWPSSSARTIPASAWSRATTRCWPRSGRASARRCSPPPRQGSNASRARPPGAPARRSMRRSSDTRWDGSSPGTRWPSTSGGRSTTGAWSMSATHARIDAEARLDGIYVLRTSEPAARLSPEDTVRTYKGLADIERWFPHPQRARHPGAPHPTPRGTPGAAHLFLCLLAATWSGTCAGPGRRWLFDDETLADARRTRDPVAPAKPTERARHKKHPGAPTTDCPFTASIPCSANSRPAAATPVGSPPTPRPRPCLCSPSRHQPSAAPHTSSKRSQYRELPKTEKLTPDQTVEPCPAQGTSA